jgi:hypothetical protein
MNIWQFQSNLTRRLLIWSFLSMIGGALLQISRNGFLRGMGVQFTAWGLIDALIAVFGDQAAKKRATQLRDPMAPEVIRSEIQKLRKILWVNSGLDMGYVSGGAAMALIKGKNDDSWRGHGIGVVLQGAFLLIFDLFHASKLSDALDMLSKNQPPPPSSKLCAGS